MSDLRLKMNPSLPEACYVVLHIGTGPSRLEERTGSRLIVHGGSSRFDLSSDIWVERLDEGLAKNIQSACDPPHHYINNIGYDRHLYAFVRRVPIEKSNYEGLTELHALIALSRLVTPTSTGDRYCVKVSRYNEKNSPIYAIRSYGVSP